MAKVEIDEEDYRKMAHLQGVASQIWADPEARKLLQKAHKKVDPKAATPDLDQEAVIQAPVSALEKKFDEFIQKTEAEKAEASQATKLAQLQAQRDAGFAKLKQEKWTAEGIKRVEEVMEAKGILDPIDAAAIVEKSMPQQQPVTPGGSGSWNFMDSPADGEVDLKRLIDTKGSQDRVPEKMAWDAINEMRGTARR